LHIPFWEERKEKGKERNEKGECHVLNNVSRKNPLLSFPSTKIRKEKIGEKNNGGGRKGIAAVLN